VGARASLEDTEKRKFLALPGLELRPLSRPAIRTTLPQLLWIGKVSFVCQSVAVPLSATGTVHLLHFMQLRTKSYPSNYFYSFRGI
jgi:hypothetical protein